LVLVALLTAGMAKSNDKQRIEELTVQRLNVVDANGTLRLVISNKDRMHPGVIDGKTLNRLRPVAGLLFFNDVGDEVGGLTYTGQDVDGHPRADSGLTLDQWKQDQTVVLQYSEEQGRRSAGLQVWDRSDTQRLSDLIDRLNSADAIKDADSRTAALRAVRASAEPSYRRVFVGKDSDKASVVALADAKGKARLVMKVDADGKSSIEFLDANGTVTRRLPE